MSFSILSNELLTEIFLYFTDQKSTLCNIALCSHHFNSVAQLVLVRSVEFTWKEHDVRPVLSQLKQFRDYLEKHHLLASAVRELRVIKSLYTRNEPGVLEVYHQTDMLVRCLPNIVSLHIQLCGLSSTGFPLTFLELPFRQQLRYLTLPSSSISCDSLAKLMALKHIESICIPHFYTQAIIPVNSLHHYCTSTLMSLNLGDNHIPQATFLELLKLPHGLKKLYCSIPGLEKGRWNIQFWRRRRMCELLSAKSVPTLLMAAKNSLEELTVTDFRTDWPGQNGSVSDFSMFIALKKLRVSSACFFNTPYAHMDQLGISGTYKLLPSSLEELKIDFDYGRNILLFEHGDQIHEAWQYNWLLEIASHKSVNFPRLQSVNLEESSYYRGPWGSSNSVTMGWGIPHTNSHMLFGVEFHPPEPLAATFIKADLNLSILFRAPWSNFPEYENSMSRRSPEI